MTNEFKNRMEIQKLFIKEYKLKNGEHEIMHRALWASLPGFINVIIFFINFIPSFNNSYSIYQYKFLHLLVYIYILCSMVNRSFLTSAGSGFLRAW